MSIDEIVKALAATGGAGVMVLMARFVWSMTTDELSRQRERASAAEVERDRFASENARFRHALVVLGVDPEVVIANHDAPPK